MKVKHFSHIKCDFLLAQEEEVYEEKWAEKGVEVEEKVEVLDGKWEGRDGEVEGVAGGEEKMEGEWEAEENLRGGANLGWEN